MPSQYSNAPFVSLKADQNCGRSQSSATKSFASLSGHVTPALNGSSVNGRLHGQTNGHTNGHTNGVQSPADRDDEFLHLDAPQQDLLLLHGPRQKYSLEHSKNIPDLQGDREILVQVLAIGLNPVDWKGADFGFSQPSYPWINGRDFAGIVVRAPRDSSRIKQGDVVFGPSTDYRDVRKAAYQEYVVTTDYNVTRVPQGVTVKEGAALGVAYVAAVTALGISFGLDFTNLQTAPAGPDLLRLTRTLDRSRVPQDIQNEIFGGIPLNERPQPGEWLAIWGANSMTGQISLQLAKHAGLKVACIADIAKGGARLSELGADFLVDKYDDKRAVDILKAITGGKLRFGIDCNSKDTATSLQDALATSGPRAHLLGLAGMPKNIAQNVAHHQIPIKIFHEAPDVGEAISTWLEDLLVARSLTLPEIEIAQGGLAGINDALDRLRTGKIGGKRIVVPVNTERRGTESPNGNGNGIVPNGISAAVGSSSNDLSYADQLNGDPERVRFAYWVPNVSGGLVISRIKQNTKWDLRSNVKYARTAEQVGFEYALSQIRFMAGYGAENQHEPVSFSQALLMNTERLKLIAALLPGPWNPAVAAKQIASIDNYTDGRVCVNVVSGWFRAEFASIGQWWLDHAERYRRSKEFITCLKGIWTNEKFTFKGDFYQFHDYPLKPKPLNLPGRPYPEIFQGGNSDDAKENAGSVSDYYFMNGNTLDKFQEQIADVKERAKKNNREGQVGFALNAFVICRETEEEALRVLQEIQGKADPEAVEGFRQQVQNAGASTGNKNGMWANSKFEDLVQYNDGFKTKLIGTKEQIAERIVLLKSLGVNIILTAFLHYDEEIEHFGREVIPLVRELERQGRGKDEAYEISQTGEVYRKKSDNAHKEQTKVLNIEAVSAEQFKVNVADPQARREDSERVTAWAPPSWRENTSMMRSFIALRPPDEPCERGKAVWPPEPEQTLTADAHHAFALAHGDDMFFSGLRSPQKPVKLEDGSFEALNVDDTAERGRKQLPQNNPPCSALARWDDPPDLDLTSKSKERSHAERNDGDDTTPTNFNSAAGIVQWDEPLGPGDDNVRKVSSVKNVASHASHDVTSTSRSATVGTEHFDISSDDGAGLAQWDDPPDFRPNKQGSSLDSSEEDDYENARALEKDVGHNSMDRRNEASQSRSQLDDEIPAASSRPKTPNDLQNRVEGSILRNTAGRVSQPEVFTGNDTENDPYNTAPVSWSQINDDGPPPGMPMTALSSASTSREITRSVQHHSHTSGNTIWPAVDQRQTDDHSGQVSTTTVSGNDVCSSPRPRSAAQSLREALNEGSADRSTRESPPAQGRRQTGESKSPASGPSPVGSLRRSKNRVEETGSKDARDGFFRRLSSSWKKKRESLDIVH